MTASNGSQLPARTVFAHTLRYFREHALRELTDNMGTKVVTDDVRYYRIRDSLNEETLNTINN